MRGAVASACALACVLLFAGISAAQISPGPLSKAHQKWNGPTGCVACHQVGAGSAQLRCLECHQDIALRLKARRGYHATILQATATGQDCVKCHSEHNGVDFQLVHWNPQGFDHSKVGFVLDGKHAGLACAKCHNPEKIVQSERNTLSAQDLTKTYLGLSRNCVACHEDKHQGRLGNDCQRCHNTTAWKVAGQFDHSKTRYPLTGAHIEVACQKCHMMPDKTMKYTGLAFEQCSSCHTDPHKGVFKQQTCQSCHTTAAWKTASADAKIDHSKTVYPLLGKHQFVKCESCHANGDFSRKIPHNMCADCHKDPHNGQFAKRNDGGKCESCHTVDGFKQARFTALDHDSTGYPLRGKHAFVECSKCHIPAGKSTVYKIKFAACTDCHKDSHGGQFKGAPNFNKCETCHTVNGFRPSTFTLAKHQKLNFQLTGGHAAVPCSDCHKSPAEGSPALFHFSKLTCTTCHADPHKGQFNERMAKAKPGAPQQCEVCHSTRGWNDLQAFDHSTTTYPLTGAHRATPCASCHRPPNLELTMKNVDFKAAPQQCEQCHQDPHAAQFVGADRVTRCAQCHVTMKWRPSTFDHEKTIFPLKGAHKDVPCAQCHKEFKLVDGRKTLFYKPTPTACAACHGANIPPARQT